MKKQKHENKIHLILLGETGVGKTSIMRRFINNEFISKSSSSIGIDYNFKSMKYNINKNLLSHWRWIFYYI